MIVIDISLVTGRLTLWKPPCQLLVRKPVENLRRFPEPVAVGEGPSRDPLPHALVVWGGQLGDPDPA